MCTAIQVDKLNCGACGHACSGTDICTQGGCFPSCGLASGAFGCVSEVSSDGGLGCGGSCSECSGFCTDVTVDPTNCGSCGHACVGQQLCSGGTCQSQCPGSEVCSDYACVPACPAGATDCSGSCAMLQTDPLNCGACGNACASHACANGTCTQSCSTSASVVDCAGVGGSSGTPSCGNCTACGSSCADTNVDPANCGACGHACTGGEVCRQGTCATLCPAGQVCARGACSAGCPAGETTCNDLCVDVALDEDNCGACGHACPSGMDCLDSACVKTCSPGGPSVVGGSGTASSGGH